ALASSSSSSRSTGGIRLVYSTTPSWPFLSPSSPSTSAAATSEAASIDIAVLDSSFNPPSRAHLALATSRPVLAREVSNSSSKASYDAHLLLFSTQNADKGAGKAGDASLEQRTEMMKLMAKDIEHIQTGTGQKPNVAVALVDKPLIFAKSTLTWDTIKQQAAHALITPPAQSEDLEQRPRLHWVVGFDTLYRVFQLKYYPSAEDFHSQCRQFFVQERTTFVCARRDPSSFPSLSRDKEAQDTRDLETIARQQEEALLRSDNVRRWVEHGSVGMLDIDQREAALSSTQIRSLLTNTSLSRDDKKQQLRHLVPPSLIDYLVDSNVY
ncbi:Nucleotidylyl transferase, partial [Testicularia cyperi]